MPIFEHVWGLPGHGSRFMISGAERGVRTAGKAARMRQCGDCHVCCTMLGVAALAKRAGQPCPHETARGCAIHADRPRVCRDWYCLWIRDRRRLLSDQDRPDRVGLIITTDHRSGSGRHMRLIAIETRPGAATTPRGQALLDRLGMFLPVRLVCFAAQASKPAIQVKREAVRRFVGKSPSTRSDDAPAPMQRQDHNTQKAPTR